MRFTDWYCATARAYLESRQWPRMSRAACIRTRSPSATATIRPAPGRGQAAALPDLDLRLPLGRSTPRRRTGSSSTARGRARSSSRPTSMRGSAIPTWTWSSSGWRRWTGPRRAAGFCSGMAAISTIALAHLRPGDSVAAQPADLWRRRWRCSARCWPVSACKTFHFADGLRRGVDARGGRRRPWPAGPVRMIWLETPANPTGAVVDIAPGRRGRRRDGRAAGLPAAGRWSTTPSSARCCRARSRCGADLCMTSLTKYCGGHSDLLAGGVSGSRRADRAACVRCAPRSATTMDAAHRLAAAALVRDPAPAHRPGLRQRAGGRRASCRRHPKVGAVTFIGLAEPGSREHALMQRQTPRRRLDLLVPRQGGEARGLPDARRAEAAAAGGQPRRLGDADLPSGQHHPLRRSPATGWRRPASPRPRCGSRSGLEHPDDLIADLTQALDQV